MQGSPGCVGWRGLRVFAVLICWPALADNWPAWRGPDGNGVCIETNLPLHWSAKEQVRWRVPLPDHGNSTPIVWGDRVFVSQAIESEKRRLLLCFDRHNGEQLWQSGITFAETEPTHAENPQCTPTPVTDGHRVIVWWGAAGVYCYDPDGRELWHRDLGRQSHQWGYASSPILYEELCVLNFGPGLRSFLIALDKRTGETVWRYDLAGIPADAKQSDFGGDAKYDLKEGFPTVPEVAGSWAPPVVASAPEGDEIIVAFPAELAGFAPRTGAKLWSCRGTSIGAYSSPFFGDGLVGLTGCGFRNSMLAVRPGGRGDVTLTHRLWLKDPGNSKACVGSGVIYQGHMYLAPRMGIARCIELKTGETVWEERLTGSGSRNSTSSSLVLAGDRFYIPNHNADVFVVKAAPKFECLATNSLGGEMMHASLAVSDGDIFIRTYENLWCIQRQAP